MRALPEASFSVIKNDAVINVGAVRKKLKVDPPLTLLSTMEFEPLGP